MLRRCWDLRNIPCEASSVSDQDKYRRDRSDIPVRLTRREADQNRSDNHKIQRPDVLSNAHVPHDPQPTRFLFPSRLRAVA